MNSCKISLEFATEAEAEAALQSLLPDNDGHCEMARDGNHLSIVADSKTITGLLRTVDDAIGCLRATGAD